MRQRLTDRYVERRRPAAKAFAVRDDEVRGLMCIVQPSGRKSFSVQRDVYHPDLGPDGHRRLLRIKIGEPPIMSVEVARLKAQKVLADLRQGIDPRRAARGSQLILREATDLYVREARRRGRAERTIFNIEYSVRKHLADWEGRTLAERGADRLGVVLRHERITVRCCPTTANGVMRMLRAVYRRARRLDPSLPVPPTDAIVMNRLQAPANRHGAGRALPDRVFFACGACHIRRLRSDDVLALLTELFVTHGPPGHIRSDNGLEFCAKSVPAWLVGPEEPSKQLI